MVGRRELRRRNVNETLFLEERPLQVVDEQRRYSIVEPLPEGSFAPSLPMARIYDGDDDVLVVPGRIVVRRNTAAEAELLQTEGINREPLVVARGVAVYELIRRPGTTAAELTRDTLGIIATLMAPEQGERADIAPLYGFRAHQTNHPAADPEPCPPVRDPFEGERDDHGRDLRIAVVDTGWNETGPWSGALAGRDLADHDDVFSARADAYGQPYLDFAAGHGNHLAGVILQVVPAAQVSVRKAVSTSGVVDETVLFDLLSKIADDAPDIVVLPLGGPSVLLGSFGTPARLLPPDPADPALDRRVWRHPLLLLEALEQLAEESPRTLVVASAGNDDSWEPVFPAAFTTLAASAHLRERMVAVAALDKGGYRYAHSNFGGWVTASTLGVRIKSMFVLGLEDPLNDPDPAPGGADDFRDPAFAEWDGTSFAAPAVAGQIALRTWRIRTRLPGATALDAWNKLRQGASGRPGLGVAITVRNVASG